MPENNEIVSKEALSAIFAGKRYFVVQYPEIFNEETDSATIDTNIEAEDLGNLLFNLLAHIQNGGQA